MMLNLELGLGRHGGQTAVANHLHAVEQAVNPNGDLGYSSQYCLDSAYNYNSSSTQIYQNNVLLDQQLGSPLPLGWEQCLDLKSGVLFYKNLSTGSTTHIDPRCSMSALSALEANQQEHSHLRSWKGELVTWIQPNSINNKDNSDARTSDFGHGSRYGCNQVCISQQAIHARLHKKVSTEDRIDLDLRLSSSSHTANPTSQPTSPTSTSSISCASLMHMNSLSSSHSCLSDALMQGQVKNSPNADNNVQAQHLKSVSLSSTSSTSSPSPSPSPKSIWHKCEESDEDNAKEDDASTAMTTAACMRCLMFVLVRPSREPMRCPLCRCEAVNPLHNL